MRILYFYQYFTVPNGSYSTRAYEFARRWAKAGDSVTLVTSVYDKSGLKPRRFIERYDIEGIDVRMVNIRLSNKHGVAFRLATFAAYALLACWYALTRPADVVLASSGPLTVGLPGLVARYLRRRPFVFEVRDLWPEGAIQLGILRDPVGIALARWFEGLCYRSATRVVALSEGIARWIQETHPRQPVEVVPNASDNELFGRNLQPSELPEWTKEKRLVVYTGTLGLIDDCSQVLEVARVFQERGIRDVEFVLIGDGKERPLLERKAQELELKNTRLLGLMPKEKLVHWLQAAVCSLFVVKDVPFLTTASPNKIFDAFAAGVPIVQATDGWIQELLEREHCGLNVPANDPDAMADAVLRLVREEPLREELARNARRVARDLFDRSLLAGKMRSILASAAAGRRRSAPVPAAAGGGR
jgi:glycosyltransferase involved in cell wall biosynthesis